jgi:hypothetical protein
VIDHLGVHPHGGYWIPFAAAFIAAIVALRVLIAWSYGHTGSLLVAQLLHASSTGFLVLLSPLAVTPAQEALWYAGYAPALWAAVAAITYMDPACGHPRAPCRKGRHLMSSTSNPHPRTIPLPAAGGRFGRPQAGGLLGRVSPNSRTPLDAAPHWSGRQCGLQRHRADRRVAPPRL